MSVSARHGAVGPEELSARISGTLTSRIVQEFFSSSAHFPLANILFESLRSGSLAYLAKPDFFAICIGAIVQSWFLGNGEFRGRRRAIIGNLVGPAIYTCIELMLEGAAFFDGINHIAYWVFAFCIGLVQAARDRVGPRTRDFLMITENVVRASIVVTLYWIFESSQSPAYSTIAGFLNDPSHKFVLIAAPGLGVLVGLANIAYFRQQQSLRSAAGSLRNLSEWSLGRELVARAVADPSILRLQQRDRAILFMDIRGFTRWSESRSPQEVASMLDAYFAGAESVWTRHEPLISRLIADEVMLVVREFETGLVLANELMTRTSKVLGPYGLSAGIGLNAGPLLEGMIGSPNIRAYDVIGDTANTTARLCSAAREGEIIVPSHLAKKFSAVAKFGPARRISAKGKSEPLDVCPLRSLIRK